MCKLPILAVSVEHLTSNLAAPLPAQSGVPSRMRKNQWKVNFAFCILQIVGWQRCIARRTLVQSADFVAERGSDSEVIFSRLLVDISL